MTAVVLAAHGAGSGSAANALVCRQANRLAARGRFTEVAVAFHQGSPSFDTVLDGLRSRRVVVVPFFTSGGYYADRVLPRALRNNARWDPVAIRIAPPVGTDPAVQALVAHAVGGLLAANVAGRVGLLVVGHGTLRHAASGRATHDLARFLAGHLDLPAVAGFLDQEPAIETAAAALLCDQMIVIPFLIGDGEHARTDLLRRLGILRTGRVRVLPPVGWLPGLTPVLENIALRHIPDGQTSPAPPRRGRVTLVGAGPGDPGLLTLRGREILAQADVVIHDRLLSDRLLDFAPHDAVRINAGKVPGGCRDAQARINALLVHYAKGGRHVVRLKGGDPFVFGRGGEELAACRAAGIACDAVPGVTSAFAVPAAAGIPVTMRGVSRSVAVVTGRVEAGANPGFDARAVAGLDTIVVLMGRAALRRVADQLVRAGRAPDTPAACIQEGGLPSQRVVVGTLGTIADRADRAGLHAPVVTVIGQVAAFAVVRGLR